MERFARETTKLPHTARSGLMRAWLAILTARHPGVSWLPARPEAVRRLNRESSFAIQMVVSKR